MSKRTKYFIKQKLAGILCVVVALLSIKIDGEATVALIYIPFGLHLIFSKEMLFTTEYFFRDAKKNDRRS